MYIDLQNKSTDYLMAFSDVRKTIAFRRGRGWSWDQIAQMLEGLGRLADQNIDLILNHMAEIQAIEDPPELGTEADHPGHPDHPNYCECCEGQCRVSN